jgi:hypothetical protein
VIQNRKKDSMTTSLEHRLSTGLNLAVAMPDSEKIANAPVRKALELTIQRFNEMHASIRRLQVALEARHEADTAVRVTAGDAWTADGKIPPNLRSGIAVAEEELADARVEAMATETAYAHAWRGLSASIDANRDAWRVALLKDADRALTLMATARKSVEAADAEATAVLGMLGMLERSEEGETRPVGTPAPQAIHVSLALPHVADAIVSVANAIEKHRHG